MRTYRPVFDALETRRALGGLIPPQFTDPTMDLGPSASNRPPAAELDPTTVRVVTGVMNTLAREFLQSVWEAAVDRTALILINAPPR